MKFILLFFMSGNLFFSIFLTAEKNLENQIDEALIANPKICTNSCDDARNEQHNKMMKDYRSK